MDAPQNPLAPVPVHMLPRVGGIGSRPVFDAAQVASLLRAAGADSAHVNAFAQQWQRYYSRPL